MRILLKANFHALLLVTLLPVAAVGQNQPTSRPSEAQQSKQPPETVGKKRIDSAVQAIIDESAAVPAEFGADVLIRLASSEKIRDHAARVELLSRAFDLASQVEEPVRRKSVTGLMDSRSGTIDRASSLNLDRLSLQSRVVTELLRLDRIQARHLAEEIRFPTLQSLDCAEPLFYDVSPFYKMIGRVAAEGFTTKEKARGDEVAFLTPFIGTLQSHTQVGPVSELLAAGDLSATDLQDLSNMFAQQLSKLTGDPRSFAQSFQSVGLIERLLLALRSKELSSFAILHGLRQYLVANYGDSRCGEIANPVFPKAVQQFNEDLSTALQNYEIPPVGADEVKSFRIGPHAPVVAYWESSDSKRLLEEARNLRFGKAQQHLLTSAERETPEWSEELTDFLTHVEGWNPDDEPGLSDFFDQKNILYMGLIELLPEGKQRFKVIHSYVTFLDQSYTQVTNHAVWFYPAADLLMTRCKHADDCQEVFQAFLDCRNPVLNLYGRVERDTGLLSKRETAAAKQ